MGIVGYFADLFGVPCTERENKSSLYSAKDNREKLLSLDRRESQEEP